MSWDGTCLLSDLPILRDTEVLVTVIKPTSINTALESSNSNDSFFAPITLAVVGKYNEYGTIKEVLEGVSVEANLDYINKMIDKGVIKIDEEEYDSKNIYDYTEFLELVERGYVTYYDYIGYLDITRKVYLGISMSIKSINDKIVLAKKNRISKLNIEEIEIKLEERLKNKEYNISPFLKSAGFSIFRGDVPNISNLYSDYNNDLNDYVEYLYKKDMFSAVIESIKLQHSLHRLRKNWFPVTFSGNTHYGVNIYKDRNNIMKEYLNENKELNDES